jgi:hypothetical protein
MPNLYKCENSYHLVNAQSNLMGRTHYVDPGTLKFHKSRVLYSAVAYEGLLFAIVTSDALDYQNTKRGFRYAIFDLFGTCLDCPKLEEAFRTKEQAKKAMWAQIDKIDAKAVTLDAIAKAEFWHAKEMADLRNTVTSESRAA